MRTDRRTAEANAALRRANTGLRKVINSQALQIETLTGQVEALSAQLAAQVARIEELERRLGSDSSNSSKPPSSDPPYRKPERSSSRTASGRRPGKQPGTGGATMSLVDDPDETLYCDVDRCGGCGSDLTEAPVARVERRQVTDIAPHRLTPRSSARRCRARMPGPTKRRVGGRCSGGEPLQHPPPLLLLRPSGPDRLRAAARSYAAARRLIDHPVSTIRG